MRQKHFVIDGEAVVLAVDDISDFAAPFKQGEIGPDLFRAACNSGAGRGGLKEPRPALPGREVAALD
jgi:hypothetical protein